MGMMSSHGKSSRPLPLLFFYTLLPACVCVPLISIIAQLMHTLFISTSRFNLRTCASSCLVHACARCQLQ